MIKYHYFNNVSVTTDTTSPVIHRGHAEIRSIFSNYTTYLGFSITSIKDTQWSDYNAWTESYIGGGGPAIAVFSYFSLTFLIEGYILYL